MQKTESTSQDDSNNTNGFAIRDRAADRVQSSGFNRQLSLMILNRFLCYQLCSCPVARVKYRKSR
eukprot:14747-Pyramimonas_sp.AAC.1